MKVVFIGRPAFGIRVSSVGTEYGAKKNGHKTECKYSVQYFETVSQIIERFRFRVTVPYIAASYLP